MACDNKLYAEKCKIISNSTIKTSKERKENEFQANFEKLRQKAVVVSLLSLFFNILLAAAAFVCTLLRNSASTSAFAADCALDGVSSLIVFWRYYGSQHNMYMHAREQVACIYLGILFVISGAAVIGKAVADLITQSLPSSIDLMLYLASTALVICLFLFFAKLWLYRRMRSSSMLLDAINTLISAVFCVLIVAAALVIEKDVRFWYLDPMASMLLALTMAIYGVKCVYDNFSNNNPRNGYIEMP